MLKILLSGCNGKMGQVIKDLVKKSDDFTIYCGFDKNLSINNDFPVFSDVKDISLKPDVIIDFSIPIATLSILDFAVNNNIPIVIATTGFSQDEENIILNASKKIPVFKSANMSFDICIMKKLVSWLAPMLKDTDIEITETHHNRKIDSPSGTAQMLADSINSALGNTHYCNYDRHSKRVKRDKNEIGMTSIRGGNIVGEHTVQFFGEFETFEIKHTSYSRNVFAEGALKAAKFLADKPSGLYNMDDIVKIN